MVLVQSLTLSASSKAVHAGYLLKLGEGALAAYKRRYFVLQDNTLFYFADEKTARSNGQANGFIPMGATSTTVKKTEKQAFGFELAAAQLGKRNFQLAAEDESSLLKWLQVIKLINVRRVKTIITSVVEELERRGYAGVEGIFRISGGKDTINALKKDYDLGWCCPSLPLRSLFRCILYSTTDWWWRWWWAVSTGNYPQLSDISDIHALTGVLKLAIRELPEPLLTHSLYSSFVKLRTCYLCLWVCASRPICSDV